MSESSYKAALPVRRFRVSREHLLLLRAAQVYWDYSESGAPAIDSKRPYGNSYVYGDIAAVLDIEPEGEEDEPYLDCQVERMDRVHRETEVALQIALSVGKFETGLYECTVYRSDWRQVKESDDVHT